MFLDLIKSAFSFPILSRWGKVYGHLSPSQWPDHVRIYGGQGWSMAIVVRGNRPERVLAVEETPNPLHEDKNPFEVILPRIRKDISPKSPLVVFLGNLCMYKDFPSDMEDIGQIENAALNNLESESLDEDYVYNFYDTENKFHFFGAWYPQCLRGVHESLYSKGIPVEIHDEVSASLSMISSWAFDSFPSFNVMVFKSLVVWWILDGPEDLRGVHYHRLEADSASVLTYLIGNFQEIFPEVGGKDFEDIHEFNVFDTTGFLSGEPVDSLNASVSPYFRDDVEPNFYHLKEDFLEGWGVKGVDEIKGFNDRHFPICMLSFCDLVKDWGVKS